VHVLECERQRNCGEKSPARMRSSFAACQRDRAGRRSGVDDRSVSIQSVRKRHRRVNRSAPNASQVLFTSLAAYRSRPDRPRWCAAERVEQGSDRRVNRRGRMRRSSVGPARRSLLPETARREGDVRRSLHERRDALDPRRRSCHLHPDRARPSAASMPVVRNRDHALARSIVTTIALAAAVSAVSATSAPRSARSRSLPVAVPDDRRDARAQCVRRHPVAHRADTEHRNRSCVVPSDPLERSLHRISRE